VTPQERQQLADILRTAREQHGWSAREVARRAGVDVGRVTLLERCKVEQPRIDTVRAIAQVLHVPLADIYTLIHWLPKSELPALRPYMRAKFEQLPDDAVAEVERFIATLADRYGSGPVNHEDEH
jgi:transcriptional regulator with XRE-family HTH domain